MSALLPVKFFETYI